MMWLSRLFRRRTLDRDLERELAFHLEAATQDFMRAGYTRAAAERAARRELGGLDQVKEATRDARGTRWVEDWWHDLRFALRSMRATPVFSGAAVLTLALGIGATTAVWSVIDALLLRSLPIERPQELRALRKVGLNEGNYHMSTARFRQLQAELPSEVPLAGMTSVSRAYMTNGGTPEALLGQLVTGEWFSLLGVGAAAGRTLGPEDDRTIGAHPVVVLSHGYWTKQFGRDPAVIGKAIRVNGTPLTVIGVAEEGFTGLTVGQSVDAWIPAAMQHDVKFRTDSYSDDADSEQPWGAQEGIHWLTLVARVPVEQVTKYQAVLDHRFRADVARVTADWSEEARQRAAREQLALESIERGFSPLRTYFGGPLRILMSMVAAVLLIACANLAALMLARSAGRAQEFAVRVSLGARRGRLVRMLLTESTTLALVGGILGLLVARWGSQSLLRAASGGPNPIPLDVGINPRMLLFAFAITLTTGALFGLSAAVRVGRQDWYEAFKSGGRVKGAYGGRLPLGRLLVASQIALSFVLVLAAGLFVRSFRNMMSLDPGYQAEQIVAARVDVRAAAYETEQLPALYQRLLEQVRAVPGVRSASLSLHGLSSGSQRISSYIVPGRTLPPGEDVAQENYVTPDFFNTVGIVLLRGRRFAESDNPNSPRVAIVSEATARHFFGTDNPIGARYGYNDTANIEVVGMVRDARVNGLRSQANRMIYYPLAQTQEYITSVEARVGAAPPSIVTDIKRAVSSVDSKLPVREVVVLRELLDRGLWRERLIARLATLFSTTALLLAAIGLYGVVAYMVSRRRNELGVRLALGARPADVRELVLRDALITVAAGLVLGVMLALPLVTLARGLLFGLSAYDPLAALLAIAVTLAAGTSAALVPAWRASRLDPLQAIRAE